MNLYGNNPEIHPVFLGDHQNNDPFTYCSEFADFPEYLQPLDECHIVPYNLGNPLDHPHNNNNNNNNSNNTVGLTEVPDIPDTCFNYISNLLRENDEEDRPGVTLNDYMAAQVSYNKSMDAALLFGETPCISANHCLDDYLKMFSSNNVNVANVVNVGNDGVFYQNACVGNTNSQFDGFVEHQNDLPFGFVSNESWDFDQPVTGNTPGLGLECLPVVEGDLSMYPNTLLQSSVPQVGFMGTSGCPEFIGHQEIVREEVVGGDTGGKTRGRKHSEGNGEEENRDDDDDDDDGGDDGRGGKHSAVSNEWCEKIEQYGDVLLCPEGRNKPAALCGKSKSQNPDDQKDKKGGSSKVSKKRGGKREVADLRALLTRCAQCVARVDLIGAYELLKEIREHSSPCGDFLQRVAHYLANGLEARLEGKGTELTRANDHIPPCEVLKANRAFVGSVPFKIMSYYTTNKTIASLAMEAPSIHIIDFGIYYGLQWPCIIQNLSKRPNGPPKIRITGIDFPQSGFRPSERVEETGRCLAMYCEKYNVPFEYNPIAQQWEDIKLEDLKIEPNEPLVVNCLYRSHNLFDESSDGKLDSSPRDAFLRLVRKINPNIFMHGIVNSTSSVPFFLNRFKEVMFHYSALFDVFESTMSREDSERMLLESKLYGSQALNVIACEGRERLERPETFKQWSVRTQRAGFEQVQLDCDLVRRARAMVKRSFRDEFIYDEDGHWVVQGWKGRIMYAISCWKPTRESFLSHPSAYDQVPNYPSEWL